MSAGAASSGTASSGDVEAAVKRYQELRSKEQQLVSKITELTAQEQEHRVVGETLAPMEGTRKCYHLIGGVLTERTVADVLPMVQTNRDGLRSILKSLEDTLKATNEERVELQKKHGIRVVTREEAARIQREQEAAAAAAKKGGAGAAGGVLVA